MICTIEIFTFVRLAKRPPQAQQRQPQAPCLLACSRGQATSCYDWQEQLRWLSTLSSASCSTQLLQAKPSDFKWPHPTWMFQDPLHPTYKNPASVLGGATSQALTLGPMNLAQECFNKATCLAITCVHWSLCRQKPYNFY